MEKVCVQPLWWLEGKWSCVASFCRLLLTELKVFGSSLPHSLWFAAFVIKMAHLFLFDMLLWSKIAWIIEDKLSEMRIMCVCVCSWHACSKRWMNLRGIMNCFDLVFAFWSQSPTFCPQLSQLSLLLCWEESILSLYFTNTNFFLFSCYCHLHLCSLPSVGTSFLHCSPQCLTVLWLPYKMWKM